VRTEAVAAAGGGGALPVLIARRPSIDLAGAARAAESSSTAGGKEKGAEAEAEAPSGFDIPAFMRRPN
jgi:hypothetical protein